MQNGKKRALYTEQGSWSFIKCVAKLFAAEQAAKKVPDA